MPLAHGHASRCCTKPPAVLLASLSPPRLLSRRVRCCPAAVSCPQHAQPEPSAQPACEPQSAPNPSERCRDSRSRGRRTPSSTPPPIRVHPLRRAIPRSLTCGASTARASTPAAPRPPLPSRTTSTPPDVDERPPPQPALSVHPPPERPCPQRRPQAARPLRGAVASGPVASLPAAPAPPPRPRPAGPAAAPLPPPAPAHRNCVSPLAEPATAAGLGSHPLQEASREAGPGAPRFHRWE